MGKVSKPHKKILPSQISRWGGERRTKRELSFSQADVRPIVEGKRIKIYRDGHSRQNGRWTRSEGGGVWKKKRPKLLVKQFLLQETWAEVHRDQLPQTERWGEKKKSDSSKGGTAKETRKSDRGRNRYGTIGFMRPNQSNNRQKEEVKRTKQRRKPKLRKIREPNAPAMRPKKTLRAGRRPRFGQRWDAREVVKITNTLVNCVSGAVSLVVHLLE